MIQKYFYHFFISFAIFLILARSQVQDVTVYSQQNEQVTVRLTQYFRVIRDQASVLTTSPMPQLNSGITSLGLPSTQQPDVSPSLVLTSAQLQISATEVQRIEVTLTDEGFVFNLLSITIQDSSLAITSLANTSISLADSQITKISFSSTQQMFCSFENPVFKNTWIIYLQYDGSQLNQIPFFSPFQVDFLYSHLINQVVYLLAKSQNQLVLISNQNQTYQIVKSQDVDPSCLQNGNFLQFILSELYPIIICQPGNESFLVTVYNLDTTIAPIASQVVFSNYDNILDTKTVNNKVYILSCSSHLKSNILYLTTISLNLSTHELSVSVSNINVPLGLSFFNLPILIHSEELIVAFTATKVLGISIDSKQLIFEQSNQVNSAGNYNLLSVINSFHQYYILTFYSEASNQLTQAQFTINIPSIQFTQAGSEDQVYVISLYNQLQQLTITSKILPLGTQQISLASSSINQNLIILTSAQQQIDTDLQSAIIGPDLQAQAFTFGQDCELIDKNNNNNLVKINQIQSLDSTSITPSQVTGAYSTQSDTFLLTLDNNDTLLVSVDSSQAPTKIITNCKQNLGQLSQVDINGVFSFSSSESQNYSIALPFNNAVTQNSCNFPVIQTSCSLTDPFLFTSDLMTGQIFIFCNSQLTIFSYTLDPLNYVSATFALQGLASEVLQAVTLNGVLIATDNLSIVLYPYSQQSGLPAQTVIQIPTTTQQITSVILYSSSYIIAVPNDQQIIELYQYSYQNSLVPQRQLDFYDYTPDFSNYQAFYQTIQNEVSNNKPQEYFLITGQSENSQNQYLLIYMINQGTAQNQLYQALPLTNPVKINKVFSNRSYLGYVDTSNIFSLYTFSSSLKLTSTFTINPAATFTDTTSIFCTLKLQTAGLSFDTNFSFQKDVSVINSVIDTNDPQVQLLSNYFSQFSELISAPTFSVNLNNAVNSNVFGWTFNMKGLNTNINTLLSNRLSQSINENSYFDMVYLIQQGVQVYSQENEIFILNTNTGSSSNIHSLYPNCYVFVDSSTQKAIPNDSNFSYISNVYSICSDYEKQKQQLITFTVNGSSQGNQSSVSYEKTYSREGNDININQFITKIQYDLTFQLFALVKQNLGVSVPSFCLLTMNSPNFIMDCNSLSQINSLGILDVVWIESLQLNVFISATGIIYSNFKISDDTSNATSFDLNGVFQSPDNLLISNTGQIRANTFFISYDGVIGYQFEVISKLTANLVNVFYGEPGQVLSGYGIKTASSQTILHSTDLQTGAHYFSLYSAYNTTKTQVQQSIRQIIKAAITQTSTNPSQFNGCVKFYSSGNQISTFIGNVLGETSNPTTIQVYESIAITLYQQNLETYNGVSSYLWLKNTVQSSETTIPLYVSTKDQNITPIISHSPLRRAVRQLLLMTIFLGILF